MTRRNRPKEGVGGGKKEGRKEGRKEGKKEGWKEHGTLETIEQRRNRRTDKSRLVCFVDHSNVPDIACVTLSASHVVFVALNNLVSASVHFSCP